MTSATLQEAVLPKIPDSEFSDRVSRLRQMMIRERLDLLVAYSNALDPGHVRYLSDVVGVNEAAAMVVPAEGEPVVCVGPACQAWGQYKSRLKDVRIFPEVGEVAETEYTVGDHYRFSDLFDSLAKGGTTRRIGIAGRLIFPQIIYRSLQKSFPNAEIVDVEAMLFEMRRLKSGNEIACIRKACQILDSAYAEAVPKIRPGWTELGIMAEIVAGILRGGAEDTGASWTPMIPSGRERSNLCMNRNTLRAVEEGEIICLQSAATYEGYNGALATPLVLGAIAPHMKRAVRAAMDTMDAVHAALKPGCTSKEVNDAGRAVLSRTGYAEYSPYAMVHNIGCLECESPWMPHDRDYSILEGMAVCVDVFLFRMPWGSFRLEDTFAVTRSGADKLTEFNDRFVSRHFA